MSRAILVLVAAAMIIGGMYVLVLQVASSPIMYRFAVSGVLVTALGLYLLWDEFLWENVHRVEIFTGNIDEMGTPICHCPR